MKTKKLDNNPHVMKRIRENQAIEAKDFVKLLKKAVRRAKPSSKRSGEASR